MYNGELSFKQTVMTEKLPTEKEGFNLLIPHEDMLERARQLGGHIDEDYKDDWETPLVLVGVLKGSVHFLVYLSTNIEHPNLQFDYMGLTSYGSGTESSGDPKITKDLDNSIFGKNVIIVEDIVDTGYSINKLLKLLQTREPKSLKVCSLVSKPNARVVDVPIDYIGFSVPNRWYQGAGMDTEELGRQWKGLYQKD